MRAFAVAVAILCLASGTAEANEAPRPLGAHICTGYPQTALEEEITGDTTVVFQIGPDGIPIQPNVEHTSGDERLDAAALSCVTAWRYQPARANGTPITVPWKSIVTWRIDSQPPLPVLGQAHKCDFPAPSNEAQARILNAAMINFYIGADGIVTAPFVAQKSGEPTFDDEALRCVSAWRYRPATRNGVPIALNWGAKVSWVPGSGVQTAENFLKPHYCPVLPAEGLHAEGTTVLSFVVNQQGKTEHATVTQTSGNAYLDRAAITCSWRWKYHPATQNSQPVSVPWSVQITWHGGYVFVLELGKPADGSN